MCSRLMKFTSSRILLFFSPFFYGSKIVIAAKKFETTIFYILGMTAPRIMSLNKYPLLLLFKFN